MMNPSPGSEAPQQTGQKVTHLACLGGGLQLWLQQAVFLNLQPHHLHGFFQFFRVGGQGGTKGAFKGPPDLSAVAVFKGNFP